MDCVWNSRITPRPDAFNKRLVCNCGRSWVGSTVATDSVEDKEYLGVSQEYSSSSQRSRSECGRHNFRSAQRRGLRWVMLEHDGSDVTRILVSSFVDNSSYFDCDAGEVIPKTSQFSALRLLRVRRRGIGRSRGAFDRRLKKVRSGQSSSVPRMTGKRAFQVHSSQDSATGGNPNWSNLVFEVIAGVRQ
jgi:hypothetical protein